MLLPASLIKIIIFLLVWIIIWLPLAIPLAVRLQWFFGKPLSTKVKIPLLTSLYLLAPLVVWGAIVKEGMSWEECGVIISITTIFWWFLGLLLAVLGLLIMFALEGWCHWLTWQPQKLPVLRQNSLPLLGLSLLVGMVEELSFRGWILTELQGDYSYWWAGAIASTLFASLHLVWEPGKTWPQLPGLWLMGMVLTLARLVAGGNLGLAWGLHSGWVWILSSFTSSELIVYREETSPWLKGWGNEPLAGLVGILFLLMTGEAISLIRQLAKL